MKRIVELTINGEPRDMVVDSCRSLLDALRDDLGLTGTKKGCDVGDCGACTVIVDGEPVNACLMLAVEAEGRSVETIEGLQPGVDVLHPLQDAFMRYGASQCGFCTPGILMMAKKLLDDNPRPTDEDIRFGLSGNICRCTGYTKIFDAIKAAAIEMEAARS
ncbi:(2Fe-2S)-binding protein [Aminobacter sp. NyZ550]|jgi:carbon-monoxide dehydrogenase small subunit|uniref:Carbon-monoxide dehydrogenase small subunit n=1 Tax=Aminobacter ciceronei TaxID=150723 RepID=A0ABR6CCY2_9HYPH|nr:MULTISPECIES: (2Fe-2S)-binding protein [Aminobacter]WMC98324.1 (2Fe-2S)-binding protein [Aminobacter aminovorans]MBA8909120.1 carbon-monoxide dehydrogenase small subunit [Aminobacter ciceronei]MBA9022892.1 carbon-monoxide dehydrogenase small subunit [Aminobacter ciceronei]QOF73053.1 (2Fe-2S)-binding protein [Aminobacter sp. SR38]WAX94819.1 (2Fe-2S)-binding protein [Aminobacter sp. NyZ550]